jgi:hypothetical protein
MKVEHVIDNVRTGYREFYDKEGKLIKRFAREVLIDDNFVKIFGKQIKWGKL